LFSQRQGFIALPFLFALMAGVRPEFALCVKGSPGRALQKPATIRHSGNSGVDARPLYRRFV
jgi:hypothetical protein